MKENRERAMLFIWAREGSGIVNDPKDRGGLTAAYGLTLKTMKALHLDLNHDGKVDAQDVKLVDKTVAEAAFNRYYWATIHGDELPGGVDLIMADIGYLSGPGRANRFYREGHKSIDSLTTRRKKFYEEIVENDATQARYIKGWLNRADLAKAEALKCVKKGAS